MTRSRCSKWLGLLLLTGCGEGSGFSEPPAPTLDAELRQSIESWGVIPIGPVPEHDPAMVALGQALFFDKILSGNRDIACGTCHQPEISLGDGLSLAVGTGGEGVGPARTLGPGREFVPRNAPSLLNSGIGLFYMFWDARLSGFGGGVFTADSGQILPGGLPNLLTAQAMLPVLNRREMRGEPGDTDVLGNPNELAAFADDQSEQIWQAVMDRVLAIPEYVRLFGDAFPGTPTASLRFEHAARAIATFQTAAFTATGSPFDRYLDRNDAALTTQEKRGALLFFDEARCAFCHNGPFLGANGFANVGAPQVGPGGARQPPLDLGRGEIEDFEFYRFAFRVAPLRNVELTAPYTHSGAYATLENVVRHYNDVPEALRTYDVTQLSPALRDMYHGDEATIAEVLSTLDGRVGIPLDLSDEAMEDIVAFLKSLTDPAARNLGALVPDRVPSGLAVR
jgi:cytochrome c peroxidase